MPTPEIGVQLEALVRLALAGLLGALVGYERQVRHRPAGLRTYTLVSLGACLFTLVSILGFPGSEPSRVAAQIVTGIGFIGAGTIIQAQAQAQAGPGVRGVTTAAGIWAIAAVGMAAGTGLYVLAIVTAIAAFLVLRYVRLKADRAAPDDS